jgi:hypothetical protein
VREALRASVKKATSEAGTTVASTVMAGGALAGTVAAVQAVGGKKEPEVVEPTRGRPKTAKPASTVTPPVEKVPGKPHFKSPAEAQAAAAKATVAPEAVPEGSEALDMDELLNMQPPPKRAPGEVISFEEERARRAQPVDMPGPKTYAQNKADINAAYEDGDLTDEQHRDMLAALEDFKGSETTPGATRSEKPIQQRPVDNSVLDRLSKMPVSEDKPSPMTKKELESAVLDATDEQWQALTDKYSVPAHKADYQTLLGWADQSKKYDSFYQNHFGRAPEYPAGGVTPENSKAHEKALKAWAIKGEFEANKFMNRMNRQQQEREGVTKPSTGGTVTPIRPKMESQERRQTPRFQVKPTNEAQSAWGIYDQDGRLVENFTTEETAKTLADFLNTRPKKLLPTDRVASNPTRLLRDLKELHRRTRGTWDSILRASKGIHTKSGKTHKTAAAVFPARTVLKHLIDASEGPFREVLERLNEYMDDATTIHFQYVPAGKNFYGPPLEKGGMATNHSSAGGLYIPRGDEAGNGNAIYINTSEETTDNLAFVKTIMHEMWHAVTHDYIIDNWDSPHVKRIRKLHEQAWNAMTELTKEMREDGWTQEEIDENLGGFFEKVEDSKGEMGLRGRQGLYGLTNPSELIAEAMSNPIFMKSLAKASTRVQGAWAKVAAIYNKIVGSLAEALGFNRHDAQLLHHIFNATQDIAMAQKTRLDLKTKGTIPTFTAQSRPEAAGPASPYGREGQLKTKPSILNAIKLLTQAADKVPGVNALRTTVDGYIDEVKRLIAPETLGPKAVQGATILSKWIVGQMRRDMSFEHQSQLRREFWEKNAPHAREFIEAFERGWIPKDPQYREIAQAYRDWSAQILKEDQRHGIEYEERDNYLYHVYQNSDKLSEFLTRKFGSKWGNPKFMKDRSFDIYEEAIKAGFKLKYTNPEDIMLARQHASDVAHMKIGALEEMKEAGLAYDKKPQHVETVAWRSPAGEWYYVHPEANAVLHNAWNTVSLWSREGLVGGAFKGAMYLKNKIVPIKLSLSLFHFLHVLTINNATGMLRATKGLMLGNVSAAKWLKEMGKAAFYTDLISAPRFGGRIRDVFRGQIPVDQIKPHEALAIQYMIEGGMMPEQSHQYKSGARIAFKNAILRARKQPWAIGRAAYEMPFAALDWMQHWMFEKWIPSIKVASYLNEVKTALESDPSLVHDQQRRQIVFHKLAKSVDNRHGEMVYKTMFWNKWVKDVAVVNLLSLGWQMGFIREYGGGIGDLARIATKQGDLRTKIKAGDLDRPLFVAFYTAQALVYGGLLTWALTGEPPDEWKDYIYPKDGGEDPDGKPSRINTMFYTREFAAIAEHMNKEGVVGGLSHTVANKASGIFGLSAQAVTGVDDFGKEYRDPNGTAMEKLVQTMDFVGSEMTPISVGGIQKSEKTPQDILMNVAGFSKAPGYATRGKAEAAIRDTWTKYNAKTQTPYERAAYSKDMKELKDLREAGDFEGFGVKFDEMSFEYKLSAADRKRIRKRLRKQITAEQSMFQTLTWQQQQRLLDEMTPEERTTYLPFSNKSHLRRKYRTEAERAE